MNQLERGGVAAFGLVAIFALAGPAWTQSRTLPEAPGTWKAWKPFTAVASARQQQAATPALVKAFEGELLSLEAILRRTPGVSSPVGFSVETWGNLAGYSLAAHAAGQPAAGRLPIAGTLTFGAFPIFEYVRAGKTIREDTGETALQQFHVNQIGRGLIDRGGVPEWGSVNHDAFLRPLPQGEIAGLPRFGDGLVIARDPAALWTPLSQRAALDLVTAARQADVDSAQQSVDAAAARLVVVRDPAWRAKRLAEAKRAASTMPDPQAFVEQVGEGVRIEEAELEKEVGPTTGSGKRLAEARQAVAEVAAWIAELSAAELAAPSCYAASGTSLRRKFPIGASPACHPLVRPNYGYFDAARPRSAPQVVIITPIARCFDTANTHNREANSPSPAGCRANRALIGAMDKDAIRAWLR